MRIARSLGVLLFGLAANVQAWERMLRLIKIGALPVE